MSIPVEDRLPGAQLDDRGGDPVVQQGDLLREFGEQLSPQRDV